MIQLLMDTETYSSCDIKTAGGFKYTSQPSTSLICLSYKIGDERTKIWYARKDPEMPEDLQAAAKACSLGQGKAYAFNATFDMRIWNIVVVRDFNAVPILVDNWIDLQAVCARYKLPQNLRSAGMALGCATEKMSIGKQLIRKCCVPGGNPTRS